VKERGIIFTGESVRAIIAGKKTQTRRIVKSPHVADADRWAYSEMLGQWESGISGEGGVAAHGEYVRCPYGESGDLLWVKETFCCADPEYANEGGPKFYYAATDEGVEASGFRKDGQPRSPWTSSMFMPRAASRITLQVTSVRVERLQAITEDDSIAEGVSSGRIPADEYAPESIGYVLGDDDGRCTLYPTPKRAFEVGWDSINGDRAPWSSNPWVWVVGFEVAP